MTKALEKRKIRKSCYTVAIRFNVRTKDQAKELQKILMQNYEAFVSKQIGTEWKLPREGFFGPVNIKGD